MEGYVARSSTWTSGAYSLPPGILGDSGSPVVSSQGEAVGVFVGIGVFSPDPNEGLPGEGTLSNLMAALGFMQENAGLEAELKTWELENQGLLPG